MIGLTVHVDYLISGNGYLVYVGQPHILLVRFIANRISVKSIPICPGRRIGASDLVDSGCPAGAVALYGLLCDLATYNTSY